MIATAIFNLRRYFPIAIAIMLTSGSSLASDGDGRPRFTNRLIDETSPYLLLHAHNPVDWYAWGEDAFERARTDDKPIFLSVGYSTCYWCHVMEREVFADPEIAARMNEWFVNIKVDREERPDIDQIYMSATQVLTRHGGWPNSVFLTPDLEPFYAGTYFPPEDRPGRPGFPSLLVRLNDHWQNNRDRVEDAASKITGAIRSHHSSLLAPPQPPDTTSVLEAIAAMLVRYDAANGGFGGAPKFPPVMTLELLMDPWVTARDPDALQIVDRTLRAMADGGIYDQIGGGFHRYSTDAEWRVPHFEKMLYNQAQLARLYARAHGHSGSWRWRQVVGDIFRYVNREMTSPEGAFYSALDAETETVEGKYYVWTEAEVRQHLDPELAELFHAIYDLAPMPEGEVGVVYRIGDGDSLRVARGWSRQELAEQIAVLRNLLLQARTDRTYPLLDDKIITSWNGMMISAYAEAAQAMGHQSYLTAAEKAANFLLKRMRSEAGGLKRVYREGAARQSGFLEDYAFFAEGLLALHAATGKESWLLQARLICDAMVERFWDDEAGGFFYSEGGTDLLVRNKSGADAALPSGNAVATQCLLQLYSATGERSYLDIAVSNLTFFGGAMVASPPAFTQMVAAAKDYLTQGGRSKGSPALKTVAKTWPIVDSNPPPTIVSLALSPSEIKVPTNGSAELSLTLQVAEGWHVNSNPASQDWLIPTTLIANSRLPVKLDSVRYPPGKPFFLRSLRETLSVYDGDTVLEGTITTSGGVLGSGELQILVQYQACDEERCLPPGEITATANVTVVAE